MNWLEIMTDSVLVAVSLKFVCFGWLCGFPQRGHQLLTDEAIKAAILSGNETNKLAHLTHEDIKNLIKGSLRPDVNALKFFLPSEQKRHALRRSIRQSTPAAVEEITNHLVQLHRKAITEEHRAEKFMLFGESLHLIQDSYCPAHVDRIQEGNNNVIKHVRIWHLFECVHILGALQLFGKRPPSEHGFPYDRRDEIYSCRNSCQLYNEASKAISASLDYLEMVRRHIQLGQNYPSIKVDLDTFIIKHFRLAAHSSLHN